MSVPYLIKSLDTDNYTQALSIISTEGFFYNVNYENIHDIKKRLFNENAQKYPTALRLLLLALVLITETNLEIKQQKQCVEYLTQTSSNLSFKQLCAGLLIRLPNYQNYHLLIQQLHPNCIPLNIMMEIAPQIKAKKATAFENQIMKHREQWVALLNGYEFNLTNLNSIIEKYENLKIETNQFQLMKELQSEVLFLKLRIRNMSSQKINLDTFTSTIEKLIKVQPNEDASLPNQQFLPLSQLFPSSAFGLLNEFIMKVKTQFIFKFQWLLNTLKYGLNNLANFPRLTIQILQLVNTVQKVFGNGALEIESILFESKSNLLLLLENLITETQNKLFNMQQPSAVKTNKPVAKLIIEKKQDTFLNFVKLINKSERVELISCILQIILGYLSEPHDNKYIVKLNQVLDENSHKLSFEIKKIISSLKALMFPKAIVYSPGLELVYEQIIQNGVSKKRQIDTSQINEQPFNTRDNMRMIESTVQPKNPLLISEYISFPQVVRNSNIVDSNNTRNIEQFNSTNLKDSYYSYGNLNNSNFSNSEFKSFPPDNLMQSQASFKSYGTPEMTIQLSKNSLVKNNSIPQEEQVSKNDEYTENPIPNQNSEKEDLIQIQFDV